MTGGLEFEALRSSIWFDCFAISAGKLTLASPDFREQLSAFLPPDSCGCKANYQDRKQEPVTLPVKLPLLLMLGAEGIAAGISTRILPHNFAELLEAQIAILGKKPFRVLPDFPQGGLTDADAYDEGRGSLFRGPP